MVDGVGWVVGTVGSCWQAIPFDRIVAVATYEFKKY